jgi:hypothetical protein
MKSASSRLALPLFFLASTFTCAATPANPNSPCFNVLHYGARNDGSASATEAFRAPIHAAHIAGGGTVCVPAGLYVTGPIEMVSNLTLYIDAGATIRFPAAVLSFTPGRQQGIETLTPVPLIGGHDLENVAVIGRGTLTSNNEDWMRLHNRALRTVSDAGSANGPNWEHLLQALDANQPISENEYKAAAAELRPSFIRFMNSKNILIDGIHIVGSPMWSIHLLYSENAVVQNIVVEAFPGVHADGIVVDSSRYVKIANNYIDAGDDGIVLKSGKDADGLRVNRPTENVAITNCTVHHAQGAVVIGSETSGSVRNVVADNITVRDTVNGIHIKSRRGRGGVVEDIRFNNWTMENVGTAITVSDAGYQMEGEMPDPGAGAVSKQTPVFRNIAISNITINGSKALVDAEGIQEMPISGLHLSNITGTGNSGLRASYTDDLELSNVQLTPATGPSFQIKASTNLELDHIGTRKALAHTPIIRLESTPDAILRDSIAPSGTDIFHSIPPDDFKNVFLQGNFTANAATPVSQTLTAKWPPPPPSPRELCLVQFDRQAADRTLVGNQAKVCLDIIALDLQRSPNANLALIGNTASKSDQQDAIDRATNSKNYLVQQKGIDPSRVQLYFGTLKNDGPVDIDQIEAEMVAGVTVNNNVETILLPRASAFSNPGLSPIK